MHGYVCARTRVYSFSIIYLASFGLYAQSPDNSVVPTAKGIAIPIWVWNNSKEQLVTLRQNDVDLKKAMPCGSGTFDHQNQMGFFECGECNPFWSPLDPVFMPPRYSPVLDDEQQQQQDSEDDTAMDHQLERQMIAAALAAEMQPATPPTDAEFEECHLESTAPNIGAFGDEFVMPTPPTPDAPKKKKRCITKTL